MLTAATSRVTKHAVTRYIERVERCSRREAYDRLEHALSISRPLSDKQMRSSNIGWDAVYRYCPVENLVLICRRQEDESLLVLTVLKDVT